MLLNLMYLYSCSYVHSTCTQIAAAYKHVGGSPTVKGIAVVWYLQAISLQTFNLCGCVGQRAIRNCSII